MVDNYIVDKIKYSFDINGKQILTNYMVSKLIIED